MFRSEYLLRQQAAIRDGRSKVGDDARKARSFDPDRGAARCGWSAERYLSLIVVVLALIVAASLFEASASTERSWRHTWLVATAHVARLPDAVRQELCPYGLID